MHLFIEYDDDILWDYYDVTVMDVVREYEINQRKPKCRYIIEEAFKNMLDDFVASSPRRGRARNRPDACYAAVVTDGNNGQKNPGLRPRPSQRAPDKTAAEWYVKEHTVSGVVSHSYVLCRSPDK